MFTQSSGGSRSSPKGGRSGGCFVLLSLPPFSNKGLSELRRWNHVCEVVDYLIFEEKNWFSRPLPKKIHARLVSWKKRENIHARLRKILHCVCRKCEKSCCAESPTHPLRSQVVSPPPPPTLLWDFYVSFSTWSTQGLEPRGVLTEFLCATRPGLTVNQRKSKRHLNKRSKLKLPHSPTFFSKN